MGRTFVQIGGVSCLAHRAIEWHVTTGVHPYTTALELDAASAATLLKQAGRPLTLKITSDDESLVIDRVYVLGEAPASADYLRGVLLADRRWMWRYAHVTMSMNVRRRTGNRRLLTDSGIPPEIPPIVDDVSYAVWSLASEGAKWSPVQAVRRVLELVDPDAPMNLQIGHLDGVPIENLEIDDAGPSAISRVLDHVPGATVTVLPSGSVVVFDGSKLDEAAAVLAKTGPAVVGGPLPVVRHYAPERPSKIHVLLTVEQELKFTSTSEASGTTTASRKGQLDMDNVLPVPDLTLAVPGLGTVARGTWITFNQAISAWNANGGLAAGATLSHEVIQTLWLYNLVGYLTSFGNPNAAVSDWGARVAAIKAHYRQTYRLQPYWMARIKSLRGYRVAIIDPENGTRAPATCYSDFAILANSERARFAGLAARGWVQNYPGFNALLSAAKAAPATVTVVDDEQGIVHLNYQGDPLRLWSEVIPGRVTNAPNLHWGMRGDSPITSDTPSRSGAAPRLAPNHQVSIVLTAVPAAPNSIAQLHDFVVTPAEAGKVIGGDKTTNAAGPEAYVRVGAGTATARLAWSDADETAIRRSFGIGQDGSLIPPDRSAALDKLLVDADETKQVAVATAAQVYAEMADRLIGGKSVRLDSAVRPAGNATEVSHGVSPDGAAITTVGFVDAVPALQLLGLLSDSVRRQLFRLTQP